MAKRVLPEKMKAAQFKKGQSGNPKGRLPLSPIQRALKELTIDTYREVIELVLTGNIDALREMIQNPKTSAIQVGVASAFLKAIKNGDYQVIEQIAARIVGKIPDQVNVISKNLNANVELPTESKVTKEEVKAVYDELEREV